MASKDFDVDISLSYGMATTRSNFKRPRAYVSNE